MIVTYDYFILSGIIDTLICPGNTIQLFVNGCSTCNYNWQPSGGLNDATIFNPSTSPTSEINYTVTATDISGCTNSFSTTINVDLTCYVVTMPSAFSPNNDGSNDYLHPLGKGVKTIEWSVYNRWGELVYSSGNFYDKWNGKFKNVDQPIGVYVWKLNATITNGEQVQKEGKFILLR